MNNVMKKLVLGMIAIGVLFPQQVAAHSADQPPYMMVGGKYTAIYPVYGSTVEQIHIPNDIAADSFIVDTPVDFAINAANLPLPEEMVKEITFSWEFGDGEKTTGGLSVSHTYTKVGSYMAYVYAIPPAETQTEPILLQSTLINIVPELDYQIPKSVIRVNETSITDPLVDVLKLPLTEPIAFSGVKSTAQGKIVSYEWDFGNKDYKNLKQPNVTYTYNLQKYKYGLPLAFVVLRVKDENGLIADSYVQITNTTAGTGAQNAQKAQAFPQLAMYIIVGIIVGLFIVILLTVKKRKSS